MVGANFESPFAERKKSEKGDSQPLGNKQFGISKELECPVKKWLLKVSESFG